MLATLPDYEALYGDTGAEAPAVEARLAAASSLVQQACRQTIELVAGDVAVIEDDGSGLLQLPQLPVVAVSEVRAAGLVLAPEQWRLLPGGQVRLLGRSLAACRPHGDPDLIEVTYDHGSDPVPPWVVERVCSMVQRAVRPEAMAGITQETTGSQSIAYVATAAGSSLWLTQTEAAEIRGLLPPVLA